VGRCPTWWLPCQILVAPSVKRCKVWLMPTTGVPCSNAAKTRNPLKLAGVPKLPDKSRPLVGRSSPYCEDMWRRYCCLTSFFPIVDTCVSCKDIARQSCAMVRRLRFLRNFCPEKFSYWATTTKMYIWCTSPRDGQTSCKVWLTSIELCWCSNESKTRNPLKFAGMEDMWRTYCRLTSFFSDCRYMP